MIILRMKIVGCVNLNPAYQKNNRAIEPSRSIYRQNNGKMSVRLNLISLINNMHEFS